VSNGNGELSRGKIAGKSQFRRVYLNTVLGSDGALRHPRRVQQLRNSSACVYPTPLFRRLTLRSATGKSQRDFPSKIKNSFKLRTVSARLLIVTLPA